MITLLQLLSMYLRPLLDWLVISLEITLKEVLAMIVWEVDMLLKSDCKLMGSVSAPRI